jgi:hypothetical protein
MAEWWESDSDFNADWTDDDWGEVNNNDSWDWLSDAASGVSDWYKSNKDWLDPAVDLGKTYYARKGQADQAKRELANLKPWQDFSAEAIARQRAYMNPEAVEAGVGADLDRISGMLSQQYRRADQPRYASAFSKGKLGASTFGRQMAMRDSERDTAWANKIVPAAYDRYYNRGATMSNADTAIGGMFRGQPILQNTYEDRVRASDPWRSTLDQYLT